MVKNMLDWVMLTVCFPMMLRYAILPKVCSSFVEILIMRAATLHILCFHPIICCCLAGPPSCGSQLPKLSVSILGTGICPRV